VSAIYLDACCLNRPYNDQSQPRIRLESEAVLLVLRDAAEGSTQLVGSTVLEYEIDQTADPERRRRLRQTMAAVSMWVEVDDSDIVRGVALETLGFRDFDALHIACAEKAGVDVFLTTDDKLLKRAKRLASQLRVKVENPATWIGEEEEDQ
jgi:predicted nucleic acid-binding protein